MPSKEMIELAELISLPGAKISPDDLERAAKNELNRPDFGEDDDLETDEIQEDTKAQLTEAAETEKVTLFQKLFAGIPEIREELGEGKPLGEVLYFFDDILSDFGLTNPLFFSEKAADIRLEFVGKFLLFRAKVDNAISKFIRGKKAKSRHKDFSKDWESRQKTAAYFAFFIHYGEQRKYDQDSDGQPKGYIEHLFDAVFNRLFGDLNFLHELTALAVWCHDTKENFSRGLFAALSAKTLKDLKRAVTGRAKKISNYDSQIVPKTERFHAHIDDMFAFIEPPHYRELFETSGSVLAYLVTGVSKGIDADRQQGLAKLCEYLTAEDGEMFVDEKAGIDYRWLLLMIKLADRLSNSPDYKSGLAKVSADSKDFADTATKIKKLENETVLIYILLAEILGMRNIANQLRADVNERNEDKSVTWGHMHRAFFEYDAKAQQALMDLFSTMSEMYKFSADLGETRQQTVGHLVHANDEEDETAGWEDDLSWNLPDDYYLSTFEIEVLSDPTYMKQVMEIDFFMRLAEHLIHKSPGDFPEEQYRETGDEIDDLEDKLRKFDFYRNLLLRKRNPGESTIVSPSQEDLD